MSSNRPTGEHGPGTHTREQLLQLPGLTQRSEPPGWERGSGSPGPDGAQRPPSRSPRVKRAATPKGWRRSWRYAMGLVTMLRRSVVVRRYPVHLQLESAKNLPFSVVQDNIHLFNPASGTRL